MVIQSQTTAEATGRRAAHTHGHESPVHQILLVGDALNCLSTLRTLPDVDVAGTLTMANNGYSAAVLGITLPDDQNAATVKANLNTRIDECMMLARRLPSLKHILLVIGTDDASARAPRAAQNGVLAACDSVSQTIQAEVEQRVGAYVIVTIILAGRCNDPVLLADRVLDRVTQTEVADAAAVVQWEEIRGDSIGDVGLNQYI